MYCRGTNKVMLKSRAKKATPKVTLPQTHIKTHRSRETRDSNSAGDIEALIKIFSISGFSNIK